MTTKSSPDANTASEPTDDVPGRGFALGTSPSGPGESIGRDLPTSPRRAVAELPELVPEQLADPLPTLEPETPAPASGDAGRGEEEAPYELSADDLIALSSDGIEDASERGDELAGRRPAAPNAGGDAALDAGRDGRGDREPQPPASFPEYATEAEPPTDPARLFRPPSIPGFRSEVTQPLDVATLHALRVGTRSALSRVPVTASASEPAEPDVAALEEGITQDTQALADAEGGAIDLLEADADPLQENTVEFELPVLTVHSAASEASAGSTDESRTLEGAPCLDEESVLGADPPPAGSRFEGPAGEVISLEAPLGEQRGAVFYRARIEGEDQPYTAVWSSAPAPEPPWAHIPESRIVRPRVRVNVGRGAIRLFERPRGNTVLDYLGDGHDRLLPAMATLELGIELAEILEAAHGAGQRVYDLDPSQIVIERSGRVRLYTIQGLYPQSQMPVGPLGVFVAPEVRRKLSYLCGQHSDVYSAALIVYALLAKRAPIDEDLEPALIPNPRTFRPECPLGIWPYLQPCLSPVPGKRIGHARGLRAQLEKARQRLLTEAQAADTPGRVVLEAWAELHTGLGKARRGADQQDRALSVTDDEGNVGLYLISDGVSRSRYGDGAFAAAQVEASAIQRWNALEKAGPAALSLTHAQRADVLRQIGRSAGKRIAQEVNQSYAPIANEPNQVMSATLVSAFVVNGEATVANLGDSRGYLIREGTIERITIDHDRATDALRMGLGFRQSAEIRMGAALTRVVGRVLVDESGSCQPDPFDPEIFRVRLLPGDRLLICSDGVPDFAAGAGASQGEAEKVMLACLLEHDDPARAAFELVVLANRAGGYDNISCVVIAAHAH